MFECKQLKTASLKLLVAHFRVVLCEKFSKLGNKMAQPEKTRLVNLYFE